MDTGTGVNVKRTMSGILVGGFGLLTAFVSSAADPVRMSHRVPPGCHDAATNAAKSACGHSPCPSVYAYLPARGRMDGQLLPYLREVIGRLDEVLARKIEIRECQADFSDADFSLPSFACGIGFSSDNAERFRFPLQAAGSRRVDLLALPASVEGIRAKLKSADVGLVRIGCLREEHEGFRRILDTYALENSIAFELVPYADGEACRGGLSRGAVDLVASHSGGQKGLAVAASCGFVDFYLAPTAEHPEIAVMLDKAFTYLQLDDPKFLQNLESRFFGVDADGIKIVRLGAYVESGLSVRGPDGSYEGFVIDYMNEIARRAGWLLKIVPLSFAEAQRALAEGTIDVMGAAVWTEARAKVYDYSKFDMGPLCYALMKRKDGRMVENRPGTWDGAKIGYQRGSLSVHDLERFFEEHGVNWKGEPFNDLKEAEKRVREGRLDAVYTLANEQNRDLVPLVMLPTKLCYFCTNKRKPWLKAEMDEVTEDLLRDNHQWMAGIYERHLASPANVLFLTKEEIGYVRSRRGKRVRVAFLDGIDPVVSETAGSGVGGIVRRMMDAIAERSGLEFSYSIGEGPADVCLRVDGSGETRSDLLCLPDWYRQSVCRVRRKENVPEVKGTAAIMKSWSAEIAIASKNGIRPVVMETREDCYRAVAEGRVEYLVDQLPVAVKWIDLEKRYDGLFYQRIDKAELSRSITLYAPTSTDPRLLSILDKARNTLSVKDLDQMMAEAVYGGSRPLSAKVKSALLTALLITLGAGVLLLLTLQHLRVERAVNRAKTQFLFNMSHDIRTPMNAIRGFSGIARKHLGDPVRIADCLDKIDSSGELLQSLIDGVLDMSRIESGKAKLEERPGDVLRSFAGVEPTMRELAKGRDTALDFEFRDIVDRYVYVDFEKANRIFMNLISNAIKYSKPNGWVKVRCEQVVVDSGSGGDSNTTTTTSNYNSRIARYRYTFEDNGIGMSEEFQKHLFEQFSRERNSTTSGVQGTGLGLALCKSLIELMGGTIECRSKLGEGTTFTVELPLRVREAVDEAEKRGGVGQRNKDSNLHCSPPPNYSTLFAGKRVLLVEDNELNREVAEFLLKEQGFEVDTAFNGQEAVEKVVGSGGSGLNTTTTTSNYNYDLILMDIQMPIMGGYEATRRIRAWEVERRGGQRKIPIIALSANAFAEDKAASIAAGMDDHIAKPIKVNELLTALARFGGAG